MPLVTNTLRDPARRPLDGVSVQIQLITGDRADQPGFSAGDEIASSAWATTDDTGTWTADLVANAAIEPAGSYYEVTEHTKDGPERSAIVVPTGAGPYRVGAILVAEPPAPAALAIAASQRGVPGGIATLGPDGRLSVSQAPIGSGSPAGMMPLFSVADYGAVGDGIADDTDAFVAAAAALFATGQSGYVYVPPGTYRNLVTFAVGDDASAHTYNAAIRIPYRDAANTPMVTWGIIGPQDAVALVGRKWPGDGQQTRAGLGAPVIQIEYETPFDWSAELGHPAFIGAPHDAPSNVHWHARGLIFRQPDNPSLAAMDLQGVETCDVDQLYFDTTAYPDASAEPTHPTGTGIVWPHNSNAAVLTAGRIGVWGHFAGIGPAEHLRAGYVYVLRCRVAHPVREGLGHACHFGTTVSEENAFVIAGYDPSSDIGVVAVPDHCIWRIDLLDVEDYLPVGADWAYTVRSGSHVYDPNNHLRGLCVYLRHNSGPDGSRGDVAELTGRGGANMVFRCLMNGDQVNPVTQTGHDPTLPDGGESGEGGAVSLFGDSVPASLDVVEGGGLGAVGTVMQNTVAGSIPTVCWRTPDSASPPVQEIQWAIWGYDPATHSATGILATGVFAAPGTLPANQRVTLDLAEPLHLDAYTTFVVGFGPVYEYTATPHAFDNAVTNGPLTGPAGSESTPNGMFVVGTVFAAPNTGYNNTFYGADVVFVPN